MTAVVGIQCDACGKRLLHTTVSQPAAGPVRDHAKAKGWHKVSARYATDAGYSVGYSRDICGDCWKAGKR